MRQLALARIVVLLACCVLAGCDRGGPRAIDAELKAELVHEIGETLVREAYAHHVDWTRWAELAAQHQAAIDEATTERELGAALNLALDDFEVSHLWIWTPDDMRVREAGRQYGIGIKTVPVEGGHLVTTVILGGPGDVAGVKQGDVIVTVDGEPATAAALGRDSGGQLRRLGIVRGNADEPTGGAIDLDVTNGEHSRANASTFRWVDGDIALITIPSFSRSFYQSRPLYLEDTIEGFFDDASTAAGVILDLRSNGGGYYLYPEHLAGLIMGQEVDTYYLLHVEEHQAFLDGGGAADASLLQMARTSGQIVRPTRIRNRRPYYGPVAVLVDGRSGSGGETFPAMVQASGRGVIIGAPTAGKVLGGNNRRLLGGYELFFPQSEAVMPTGVRLEGNGVTPDIVLNARDTANDGVILDVAVTALRSRTP